MAARRNRPCLVIRPFSRPTHTGAPDHASSRSPSSANGRPRSGWHGPPALGRSSVGGMLGSHPPPRSRDNVCGCHREHLVIEPRGTGAGVFGFGGG